MKTKILLFASLFFLNFSTTVNDIEDVFSETKKIEIYGFYNFTKWDKNEIANYFNDGKIIVPVKYLRNKIVLNQAQTLKLKKTLINTRQRLATIGACQDQRHAIVFYNKRDKAIGYVNICFENSNSIPSKELEMSERLVHSLIFQKELFKEFGITYFKDNSEDEKINKKLQEDKMKELKKKGIE